MAALLTRTSMRPKRSIVASASARVLASSATSTRAPSAGGAERLALGGHRARLLVADVGDHHVRALAREAQCVSPADTLRGARDDRDAVTEAHGARSLPRAPLRARARPPAPRSRSCAAAAGPRACA